jgi:GAF domain-containing protein/ActR/RegA family two-component response regulator
MTGRGTPGARVMVPEVPASRLHTLARLTGLVSSSLDSDQILGQIATAAAQLTDTRLVAVWVADEATRALELRAFSDEVLGAGYPHRRLAYGQGGAGWVADQRRPLQIDDVSCDPRVRNREWFIAHGLRSVYSLPIIHGESLLGVVALFAAQPFRLPREDHDLIETFVAQAAGAIRNARLFAESERRRRAAEALAQLGRLSIETIDLGAVARRVVESVRTLLGVEESALYRVRPESGDLEAVALSGEAEVALGTGIIFPRGTGVVGLAVNDRRPIASSNLFEDPRITHAPDIRERLKSVSYRAILAVPLLVKDRVIGALAACAAEGRVFSDDEIRLAQAFADQASLVLENAQLFDDAARRRHETDVLAEVIGQINGSLDLSTILARIADGACELTGADGAQIALREPGSDAVRTQLQRGGGPDPLEGILVRPGKGAGGFVLATGQPFRTANYAEDPRITKDYAVTVRAAGIVAEIVVPIRHGGINGLLYVFNRTARPFTDRDEAALSRLADHAVIAIGNASLHAETDARRREAESLTALGRLISQSLEPLEVGQRVVESLCRLLGAGMASLYQINGENGDFVLLAGAGKEVDWNRTLPRDVGTVGLAVRQGGPVCTSDILTDPRISLEPDRRAVLEAFEYRAILALPLVVGDRIFGAMSAHGLTGRVFSPDEIRLAQSFVDQAAIALENARLYAETTRRRWEAEVLADVGRLVTEAPDTDQAASRIADCLRALLGGISCALAHHDPTTGGLVGRSIAGDGVISEVVFPPGTGASGRAVATRRPIATTNVLADPRITLTPEQRADVQTRPYRSVLALPMIVHDRVIGAISVGDHEGRVFDVDEMRLAQAFADQAAMALERSRWFRDAQQRRREAEVLADLASQITASLDLDTILRRVSEGARELCRADLSEIAIRDEDSDAMVIHHSSGSYNRREGVRIDPGNGLGGKVLATRRPVRTDDYASDPRISEHFRATAPEGVVAMLVVPIQTEERIEGLLYVENRARRPFTDRDEELLTRLAAQAVIAIRNAQLVEAQRAHQARLEALLDVSRQLSKVQPTEQLLEAIAAACGQVLGSESVGFRLVEGDELVVAGLWGDAKQTMSIERLKFGESLSGVVATSGQPVRIDDLTDDPRVIPAHREAVRRLGYRNFLGVPVKVGERVVGVLSIRTRRPEGFSAEDETTATAFASQAATALENARLFQQVQISAEEVSRAKDALLQAQKMEAIGRLAGGVAHDFNNLLTIIHGRCEILLKRLEPGTKPMQDLELIQRTALRAAALTKQLLAFSRQQVLQPQILSVNAAVSDSVSMLRRLIGEDITLVTLPGAPRDTVKADRTQLEQVLMNLAINARDAMLRGGRLVIETADVELDEAFVREHPDASVGPHVRLSVIDDGIGMSPEVVARIFEPFFTTKDKGRGTGLGLAMVYGIVKQHNGCIGVRSVQGKGTTFDIYLPHVDEPAAEPEVERLSSSTRGSETILLVEDEDDVRELSREILEMAGYVVLEAPTGADALRLCAQHRDEICLLLTDVVMPQMSGPDLARQVEEIRPGTRVVYMSGYTDDALGHHGVLDPGIVLLPKPFTPDALLKGLRQALDAPAPSA